MAQNYTGRPRCMFLRQRKNADCRFLPQKSLCPTEEKNINSSNSAHPSPWADSRAGCQPPPSSQLREPPIQVLCIAGCTWVRSIQAIFCPRMVSSPTWSSWTYCCWSTEYLAIPGFLERFAASWSCHPVMLLPPTYRTWYVQTICNCWNVINFPFR